MVINNLWEQYDISLKGGEGISFIMFEFLGLSLNGQLLVCRNNKDFQVYLSVIVWNK